jgi:ADP-ribose pyrophosphatase
MGDFTKPVSAQPLPPEAKLVFKGIMFNVYQWEQQLYDGTTKIFEKLTRPDTVIIFPVLDDGRILLTEQGQPGVKPFIAAAGGRVDPGEDILAAAERELLEETGYEAREFALWDTTQPFSKIEWSVYTFIAKGLTKALKQTLDGGEQISLKPVSFEELLLIGTGPNFSEHEIVHYLYEARLDPKKKEELRKLFMPLQ